MGRFEIVGNNFLGMGEDGVFGDADAINRVPTIRGTSDRVVCVEVGQFDKVKKIRRCR